MARLFRVAANKKYFRAIGFRKLKVVQDTQNCSCLWVYRHCEARLTGFFASCVAPHSAQAGGKNAV